jgi:hypothetical protein
MLSQMLSRPALAIPFAVTGLALAILRLMAVQQLADSGLQMSQNRPDGRRLAVWQQGSQPQFDPTSAEADPDWRNSRLPLAEGRNAAAALIRQESLMGDGKRSRIQRPVDPRHYSNPVKNSLPGHLASESVSSPQLNRTPPTTRLTDGGTASLVVPI